MDHPLKPFGSRPVLGRFWANRLRAHVRLVRKSLQTHLIARLVEQGGQTHIRCRFYLHPMVIICLTAWFGCCAMFGGGLLQVSVLALGSGPFPPGLEVWFGLALPPAMLAFGVFMLRFGRHLARDDRQILLDFVRESCSASEARPFSHGSAA